MSGSLRDELKLTLANPVHKDSAEWPTCNSSLDMWWTIHNNTTAAWDKSSMHQCGLKEISDKTQYHCDFVKHKIIYAYTTV